MVQVNFASVIKVDKALLFQVFQPEDEGQFFLPTGSLSRAGISTLVQDFMRIQS